MPWSKFKYYHNFNICKSAIFLVIDMNILVFLCYVSLLVLLEFNTFVGHFKKPALEFIFSCLSFKNCFCVFTGAIILTPAFYFFDLLTVIQLDSDRPMHIQFTLHTAVCKFLLCCFFKVFEIAFIAWKLICELLVGTSLWKISDWIYQKTNLNAFVFIGKTMAKWTQVYYIHSFNFSFYILGKGNMHNILGDFLKDKLSVYSMHCLTKQAEGVFWLDAEASVLHVGSLFRLCGSDDPKFLLKWAGETTTGNNGHDKCEPALLTSNPIS